MKKLKNLSLGTRIFIGLAAGVLVGLLLVGRSDIAEDYIRPWGDLFLNLIKFIIVPVVIFSIMNGVISMKDISKVGSIGLKAVVFYTCTTAFAIFIGLVVANLFKGFFDVIETADVVYEAAESPRFLDTFIGFFPTNIIEPLLSANMLQVIFIAVIMGFGVIAIGKKGETVAGFIESMNEVVMKVMMLIIKLSPIGVFCLIAPVLAENGPSILEDLALVILAAYACFILHMFIVYVPLLKIGSGIGPIKFFKNMAPAMMFAFSSSSSVGTLPLNMESCEKLGARKSDLSFTLPLGATLNMDGTAIYQGVAAIFIATCYGIDLTAGQMLTVVLTVTLASLGTAGVPGSGMIMLAMVLDSVGLPVAGIALVAGVDRIFDMGRTTLNITGDAVCSLVVSKMEQKKEAKRNLRIS